MTATERRPASAVGLPERADMARPVWRGRRHVLDLDDWEPGEVLQVLDTAVSMKQILDRPVKKLPTLRGKTIVTAFYESSTRTRISFEVAAKILGADAVNMTASASSVTKGESLRSDLDDWEPGEVLQVLDTAVSMKQILDRPVKKLPTLRGKTIVTAFYESSTRTRISFEVAAKILGADAVNMTASASSVTKGESLIDTIRTLEAIGADAVVIRHPRSGAPWVVANQVDSAIINGGDGWHAHPTQALLDLFTMRERLGRIAGVRVTILGDVLHSRVARSDIWGLAKMGAEI